jgi:hypothetical protein
MLPQLRKVVLTAHITTSVGWLGAVAVFGVLALVGLRSTQTESVRGAYLAMQATVRYVIVPLALASLTIGVVQALGTPWGLFRHYWVGVKLAVTAFATVVLLLQLGAIDQLATLATERPLGPTDLAEARVSLVAHATGGLVVLLIPTVLSVFKPRGLTRHGRRTQRTRRPPATAGEPDRYAAVGVR